MLKVFEEKELFEMALVNTKLCRNLGLQVAVLQGGEGNIPHVHVVDADGLDTCVNLMTCEYFAHGKHKGKMNKKQKDKFVQIMDELTNIAVEISDGNFKKLTGYQNAVKLWVESYEDDYSKFVVGEDGLPVNIDYSKL